MTAANEMIQMIDKLVAEKTFGLEGLTAIKALKDKAESLEKMLTDRDNKIVDLQVRVTKMTEQNSDLQVLVQGISAREKAVAEREAKIAILECARAVSDARASTFEQAMRIVFAPNVVRENIMKYGNTVHNGMTYPTSDGGTSTHTSGYAQPGQQGDQLP